MDKVTIFIIVLFWIVSAIFKAIQKSGKNERNIPKDRIPPQTPKPLFQEKPEKRAIQIDDLYSLLEPQKKEKPEAPPSPVPQTPVSLEELFINTGQVGRSASQTPLAFPPSQYLLKPKPPIVQKEPDAANIPEAYGNLGKKVSEKGIFVWKQSLSPWQRAVILHEILQPPKTLRRKNRRPYI